MIARVGTAVAVALAALVIATERLILHPAVPPPPPRVDAVVVLSGGGPRTAVARKLVQEGLADVMFVSNGGETRFDLARVLCPRPDEHCFTPEPPTTQGEARAIRELVAERQLASIAVLTKRGHVTRAKLLLKHCVDAEVHMVALDRRVTLADTVHEWGGLVKAAIWRDC